MHWSFVLETFQSQVAAEHKREIEGRRNRYTYTLYLSEGKWEFFISSRLENGRSPITSPADPTAPDPPAPAGPTPQAPAAPPPGQPTAPQAHVGYQLNWSHFRPEFAGRPEEDAEAHLLHTNDWMNTHNFPGNVKVQRFCLTFIGEARLWYESLRPVISPGIYICHVHCMHNVDLYYYVQ